LFLRQIKQEKTMTEKSTLEERIEKLLSIYADTPVSKTLGMKLGYDDESRSVVEIPYQPELRHALGDTHGGVIGTMLDTAGWFAAATQYDTWVVTADLQMRLLTPARRQDLAAAGTVVQAGQRLCVCTMEVRTKANRLVAIGSGSFAPTARRYL
jgi:uncharacterized protein (TIGR00369 family)